MSSRPILGKSVRPSQICGRCLAKYIPLIFDSGICSSCRESQRLQEERRSMALVRMNQTKCGFCDKQLIEHNEFDLKCCLYSLRGYTLKKQDR